MKKLKFFTWIFVIVYSIYVGYLQKSCLGFIVVITILSFLTRNFFKDIELIDKLKEKERKLNLKSTRKK